MRINTKHRPGQAIDQYLERRCKAEWPVSIAEAVRSVQQILPRDDIEDQDLAEMIAIAAIERGHSICFDKDLIKTIG